MPELVHRESVGAVAVPQARPSPLGRLRSWRRTLLGQLVTVAVVGAALFLFARYSFQDFRVTGQSMKPTIRTNEMVLVDKLSYNLISPQRGDVIVFKVPTRPWLTYVKRIIAVPGDTVEIYGGKVWVNGRALYERYTLAPPDYPMHHIPYDNNSDRVPPGDYFVLGDNRPDSNDSHIWGLVPRRNIVGRAILGYWPMNRFGFLTDPSTKPTSK